MRQVLTEIPQTIRTAFEQTFGSKPRIELADAQGAEIFLVDEKPVIAKTRKMLFPTLIFKEAFPLLARIVVDMGAVPHICNGADVMAPGVVRISGDFDENDFVLVVDEQHDKPLAMGIALHDAEAARKLKHGKVAKNVHYVGDRLWSLMKRL